MSESALILVDIQNDYFEGGRWPVDKMEVVSANAARLLSNARQTDMPIIHVRHEIPSDDAPFFRPGSTGSEIHRSVAPENGEQVILKHRPNSFQDTSLHEDLKRLGVKQVSICGAMSQLCIDATARAAVDFDYQVIVVEDACGAKSQKFGEIEVPAAQVHAAFMAPLAMSYAKIVTTDAYISETK